MVRVCKFFVFRLTLVWMLACFGLSAHAGLSVYTSWGTLPPTSAANQRTIDFNTATLATEQTGGHLTYASSADDCSRFLGACFASSPGSVSYTSSSSMTGFSGNVMSLNSGVNTDSGAPTQVTVTFTNPTPFVGFLWGAQFNAENTQFINITLENGSVVTLKNCRSSSNAACVGAYVSQSWITDVYNFLLGWLFGDAINYYPLYVQYNPDSGIKIKKVQFLTYQCSNCGFLSANTSQDYKVDYITYVDAAVAPHHLNITTTSSTVDTNADVVYTITACGNAACTQPWTSGVTGTLTLSGASPNFASQNFTILAGPSNTTTVTARFGAAGSATVGMSAYTPTPSNTPKVFCGMGTAAASGGSCSITVQTGLDHIEVTTSSNNGLTCNPVNVTIKACGDSGCSSTVGSGVSGNLTVAGGTPSTSYAFTTNGSGVATVAAYTTTAGTVTFGVSGVTPSRPVYCGIGAAASSSGSCNYTAAASALLLDVPNHVAGNSQSVDVYAIKANDSATKCVPAFASTTKTIKLGCGYSSPTGGTLPVVVNGSGLNAAGSTTSVCDGSGKNYSLAFDANGKTSTPLAVSYDDAGQMTLTATYTGSGSDAGLTMVGTDTFVAIPKDLLITPVAPLVAGQAFSATVTARNQSNAPTQNFGQETGGLTFVRTLAKFLPIGTNARNGTTATGTMGAFSNGIATISNMSWDDVGYLKLDVSTANYLGSGTTVSGSTASGVAGSGGSSTLGPFVPHHFDVAITQACTAGARAFTYSGQPFQTAITAKALGGTTTQNYDGTANTSPNYAAAGGLTPAANATLLDVTDASNAGATSFSYAKTAFTKGVATLTTPVFKFKAANTSVQKQPILVAVRAKEAASAIDSDPTHSGTEGSVSLRLGRLKLYNAFGSGQVALAMVAQTHYWSKDGNWVLNSDDNCTTVPVSAVALSNYLTNKGVVSSPFGGITAGTLSVTGGIGKLTLSAPTGGATGSVDIALNLGSTSTDASCLTAHPASTGASKDWLRGPNGTCATSDPSARASFGVFSGESQRLLHSQDLF